jgi:phage shock protein PspC (stress-responsive transcriptional regulator)
MQQVNDQKFYRSNNRILGGVCAGLAEGFHVNPLWVRLAFLILVFLQGAGLFLYVVLWLLMPEKLEGGGRRSGFDAMMADLRRVWSEVQHQMGTTSRTGPSTSNPPAASGAPNPDPAHPTSPAALAAPGPHSQGTWQNQTVVLGVIIVGIGLVLLASNVGILNWSVVWPAALITFGIVILIRNLERRA